MLFPAERKTGKVFTGLFQTGPGSSKGGSGLFFRNFSPPKFDFRFLILNSQFLILPMSLLTDLNRTYAELHTAKEEAFWVEKMGLYGKATANFQQKEIALKEFSADPENLANVRLELQRDDLAEEERVGLEGWERYFNVNQIEGEDARALYRELVRREGELEEKRGGMELGYTDPVSGEFVEASSVALALKMRVEKDGDLRKAAFEGLQSIEPFVLDNGFIEVVRLRNRLARKLGYVDYYDWKVSINEGFGKDRLFEILDDLAVRTAEACRRSVEELVEEKGDAGVEPWNFPYYTSGDLTAEIDPYFPFGESFARWGRSFAALGIEYAGATLQLDLVDRRGKYSNGFMHGTYPTWVENDTFHPARINFTANAVPGQIGSGQRATQTFFHEGGHAAHFSNIRMPAPCFSQEFAPTSVAFAETQSMFLDSILGDADWLIRYAKNRDGETIPVDLIRKGGQKEQIWRAWRLRSMLAVCYAEKAIYEMSDENLIPGYILETLRGVEQKMMMVPAAPRPLLSVPHLLSGEASAYYHGYILAEMAVYQTREYFLEKYGYITDNPEVGPELQQVYWREGNSKGFLEFVEALTGRPFSAEATARVVTRTEEEVNEEIDRKIERQKDIPLYTDPVDLNATIAVVHGDDVIATTADGLTFEQVADRFHAWIEEGAEVSLK